MESTYTAAQHRRRPIIDANADADAALIARVANHDEPALVALYDRYRRLIFTIALRIAGDMSIAEEITQDVFHAVWQSAGNFQTSGSPVSWMMGIARHRAIDATRSRRYRARQRELALIDDQADLTPFVEPTDQLLLRETLRGALIALPASQRETLTMAFYGGLTQPEIADRLGQPIGTIKSRMRLGMLKLRDLLDSVDGY